MIVLEDLKKDLQTIITSEDHLDRLLYIYNFFKYVNFKETWKSTIKEHDILYSLTNNSLAKSFSFSQANSLINLDLFDYKGRLTSFTINVFLNFYYNKELKQKLV